METSIDALTDVLLVCRHDEVLGLEDDDGEPLGGGQVAERDEHLRPSLVRRRVAHHVRPDVDLRPAAAEQVLALGHGELQVAQHARPRESIELADLHCKQANRRR